MRLSSLNLCHHHLPSTSRLPTANYESFGHISSISNMTQRPSSSFFQDIFNAALEDYETQTGTRLVGHPFARQLEAPNSVDSITAALREQAQIFREFRGDDGKIMKSLKSSVDVLYTLSNSTILGEGIGLVRLKSFIWFLVPKCRSTAIPASECNIHWHCHPTCRMSPSPISSRYFRDI